MYEPQRSLDACFISMIFCCRNWYAYVWKSNVPVFNFSHYIAEAIETNEEEIHLAQGRHFVIKGYFLLTLNKPRHPQQTQAFGQILQSNINKIRTNRIYHSGCLTRRLISSLQNSVYCLHILGLCTSDTRT